MHVVLFDVPLKHFYGGAGENQDEAWEGRSELRSPEYDFLQHCRM
jgi:hypothetical protein